MARKNLLSGLTGTPREGDGPSVPPPAPFGALAQRGGVGAIGAVTRSIEQLKAQSVLDLAHDLIDPSPITDRIEDPSSGLEELIASMRDHGQQVPILVRPHPAAAGRFQIAYGRRRLRAAQELGRPVKALVRPLTDEELVIAQGQENSARTDLSFIERAQFAARLEEAGYDRPTIMAALSVDKAGLSRLIGSAVRVPAPVIAAIGRAPKAGRDRWIELAARLEDPPTLKRVEQRIAAADFAGKDSDERFIAVFAASEPDRKPRAPATTLRDSSGLRLAEMREDGRNRTFVIDRRKNEAFGAWLAEKLPELHAAFRRGDEA